MKNHTQNMVEKLVPDSFLKNQNWAHLWINNNKFYTVCFYCMSGIEDCQIILKLRYSLLAQTSYESFLTNKTKRGLELVSLTHFMHDFQRKIFSNWPNFNFCNPLLIEILGNMWCVARFGTICTILKTWKTPMEEC